MPGVPSRTFELEIAPIPARSAVGLPGATLPPALEDLLVRSRWEKLQNRNIVPVGLRWRVTPLLGLPRGPFSVWRRTRGEEDPIDLQFDTATAASFHAGGGKFHVPARPMYILRIRVRNTDPTAGVVVTALDTEGHDLPLQTVVVAANTLRHVRFQHPFISGFSCRGGAFVIASIEAVTMKGFIERPAEWELIEIAGLPATAGEVDGYDPGQQGDPSQPEVPPDAATRRLQIAQQFYEDLPTVLPSGVTLPLWRIPKPAAGVEELRGGSPSLVQRLSDMFAAVDTGAVPSQDAFRTLETMPGVKQPEFPGEVTQDAVMNVPLLATVLLNAATDSWFALAGGFGTTDFPELMRASDRFLEPANYFNVSHDYMVSATFLFRFDGVEVKQEYCALSHRSAFPPVAPSQLTAEPFALNRPAERDAPWSNEISLTWSKINRLQIQGNAIAVADTSLSGAYLNPPRTASDAETLTLFVPTKPGEKGDPILHTRNRFFHHGAHLPFAGARNYRYGVAAMDPFGRWSDWTAVHQDLGPRLPEAPRLMSLSLTPDMSGVNGNSVPHTLAFEILWDWQDRSPKRFQVAAVFHARRTFPDGTTDAGHVPPAVYPTIFQTDNTVAAGALLELTFSSDSPPGTAPEFTAVPTPSDPDADVGLLPQATNGPGQNVEGEMRRYRVTLPDVNITFAPDEEWFFSLYVKAAEWRAPGVLSDETLPLPPGRPPRLTAFVPNPIPAPPPVFVPATVSWAALPDAQDVSRFRLAFDRVPNATGGYAVYQAYEAKLRELAGLPAVTGTDLVARATELRDVAMPLGRSVDAFTRLNARLVPQSAAGVQVEYEAELSGALDGLVALAVKSVTRDQESSPLSTPWLFVAVPRRVVPGPPSLSVATGHNGTTLTCEVARAPAASRVEILRARREHAAREAGRMGPPIHESDRTTWQPLDAQGGPATSADEAVRFRFSFTDHTPASWFPYLYRAAAVGAADQTGGLVAGRSTQSNLVRVDKLPKTLPVLDSIEAPQTGPQQVTLRFRGDAPPESTSHGSFLLEVFPFDFTANLFAEDPVLSVFVPRAQPVPANGVLAADTLYASDPDASGMRLFQTPVAVSGEKFMFRIRLTDPLARTTERIVSGSIEPIESPELSDLRLRRQVRDLIVRFKSATRVEQPTAGEYRLEIRLLRIGTRESRLLLSAALHEIAVGDLAVLGASPVTTILRFSASPQPAAEYGAIIKPLFPPALFPPPPPARIRVTLTGPDGTTTRLDADI